MPSYTRRGAIALLTTGSLLWLIETDAFSSAETNQSANIGANSNKTALLGIEGVGSQTVFSEPHTITVTNRTQKRSEPQDDTRTTFASTEVAAGSSNNVGIGAPADFTGDGTASVPIVDGSNRVVLLGPNGVRQVLIGGSTNQAAKSPVAASDIDDDGTVEFIYIRNGGEEELRSVDTDGTVVSLTTSTGEVTPADKKRGVTVVE